LRWGCALIAPSRKLSQSAVNLRVYGIFAFLACGSLRYYSVLCGRKNSRKIFFRSRKNTLNSR